ncbi:glycosyltransferase family 2 protein [Chryseobacterium taiwanense]|uniref:glycosyltransferase family 2 protein n=1 Tax=Chryseobacterium taiwanense TaxID=363331 RepID=UPI0006896FAE|nr:glycosyltransferase [Chryseobacterium taiwanense]
MNQLAIIIPYYKIDFFEETLKSVAAQTNQNFTLYIGNDASPNNPLPIIDKYFEKNNYHYFEYKSNIGGQNLALQWERILENVQEEWVQILGDDDCISPDFVEEFYKILPAVQKNGITLIKCGQQWIDENNNHLESHIYNFDKVSAAEIFIKKYKVEIRSSLSENIYQTKIVKKQKFVKLPLAWGTDDLSLLDFSKNGYIQYIPKLLVSVRISAESISGSDQYEKLKKQAIHQLQERISCQFSDKLPDRFVEETIENYLSTSYYENSKVNIKVAFYYLKKFQIKQFLKAARKVYYINKKAQ